MMDNFAKMEEYILEGLKNEDEDTQKMNTRYTWYEWYNFGRRAREEHVTNVLTFLGYDNNIFFYEKNAVLSGVIRENRFCILEYYLYTEPHFHFDALNFDLVNFAISRKMIDLLEKYQGWIFINFYRYPYLVGKCRTQPLYKVKKQIDGFRKDSDNNEWIIECLKASAENKNTEVFRYLYQKYLDYKLNNYVYPREIISEALEKGDLNLVERMICFIRPKEFKKLSIQNQNKIKRCIREKEKRNILLFEKISGNIESLIPQDITRYIINRFIFPRF
jgi:hypothetical protein